MFNYTSTTIINANKDYKSPEQPLIVVGNGTNGHKTGTVLIKRLGTFKADNILSITKAAPIAEKNPKATLDLSAATITAGNIYRLALYVGLSGSQNSYYANDFVYKGKPFYVEAVAPSADKAALIDALIDNAKKYITMVYEVELVKLSKSGTSLVVDGTEGFQQFKVAELQEWKDDAVLPGAGTWTAIVKGTVEAGEPGFGTYKYLLHNHRLPTGANLRYEHIVMDEVPVLGAEYTQYILRMCVNRGVMGGDAVGQAAQSITTHCFWVKSDVVADFQAAMEALGVVVPVDKNPATPELPEEKDEEAEAEG